MDRYTLGECLGKGAYGTVVSAIDSITGKTVAVKRIQSWIFNEPMECIRVLREIKLLRLLNHKHIVTMLNVILPPDRQTFNSIDIVFEKMDMDLGHALRICRQKNRVMPRQQRLLIIEQLLQGVGYMHKFGVAHRDLKPGNILLTKGGDVKVCDLGLARTICSHNMPVKCTEYVVTRWYRAPEICGCFSARYTMAIDIWAIGCIYAEIITGRPIFAGASTIEQMTLIVGLLGMPSESTMAKICNWRTISFFKNMPLFQPRTLDRMFSYLQDDEITLLRALLTFDPDERMTADQALLLPVFDEVNRVASPPLMDVQTKLEVSNELDHFDEEDLPTDDQEALSLMRDLLYKEALLYTPPPEASAATNNTADGRMALLNKKRCREN